MSSLRKRFIAFFGLFVLLSCTIIAAIASVSILRNGEVIANRQGTPVVEKASELIDGDEFEAFLKNPSEDDPYYEEVRLALLDLAELSGCAYLYTMSPINGTVFQYVIDGSCDPSDEENFSPLATREDIEGWGSAPFTVMEVGGVANSGIVEQEGWGFQASAYKAIVTSRGTIVGFIGVDYDMTDFVNALRVSILQIVIVALIFLILGVILVSLFTSKLFGSIARISNALEDISQDNADLTTRIPVRGRDELSKLSTNCNILIERLDRLMKLLQGQAGILKDSGNSLSSTMKSHILKVKSVANDVIDIDSQIMKQRNNIESISSEILAVEEEIKNLDMRIARQSDAIQSSSSAINQISANIHSVDSSITAILAEYDNLVKESNAGRALEDLVAEQVDHIAKQSANLNEANAAISAIAEQTNLLAMNAAIEAAHAGELGKGFGVVADEIRTLAETSATQSGSIKELLEGITEAIDGIVSSSKKSADAFERVGSKISQMDGLIKEVQTGMQEQDAGVANILQTMKTLDSTTSDINNASTHMKTASSKLTSSMKTLRELSAQTQNRSSTVSNGMSEIKSMSEEAMRAAERNVDATDKVSDLITGFKA